MYVLVRCKVDFLTTVPEPVLVNPILPFPHYLARASAGSVEFVCDVPETFNVIEHFAHPVAISGITPEMYEAIVTRYRGWGLGQPLNQQEELIRNRDLIFFVASEDCRPIRVEASTPQYEKLPFLFFEGVSLVRAKSTTVSAVAHYWPDSFCHQSPL